LALQSSSSEVGLPLELLVSSLTYLGGIGPEDQLNIVKNSAIDGPTMIDSKQWISLPVGYNLNDHVGVCIFCDSVR
jgi:cellobiose dehydrogenase (acceptor)